MIIYDTYDLLNKSVLIAMKDQALVYIGSPLEGLSHMLNDLKLKDEDVVAGDLKEMKLHLDSYMSGDLKTFDIEVQFLGGTSFQRSVWQAIASIPYGSIVTYSDVAEMIGNPKAIRAVASAIGHNPIMIVVPCHRINGKDGSLRGFRGGLDLKVHFQSIEGTYTP